MVRTKTGTENLVGQRFGSRVATKMPEERNSSGCIQYEAVCDCGNTMKVTSTGLRSKPNCRKCAHVTHGKTGTKEFVSWQAMKQRVLGKLKRCECYENIRVCERWCNSFENFYEDVGDAPSPEHSLDRIDGTKDYVPGNVR